MTQVCLLRRTLELHRHGAGNLLGHVGERSQLYLLQFGEKAGGSGALRQLYRQVWQHTEGRLPTQFQRRRSVVGTGILQLQLTMADACTQVDVGDGQAEHRSVYIGSFEEEKSVRVDPVERATQVEIE